MKFGFALLIALAAGSLGGCSNPFAPKKHVPEGNTTRPPAPPATSPEILLDNLNRAFNDRDEVLYETLLDENFWFTETDCLGELVYANGREEELEIMGGSRDGSRPGILERFRTFEYEFTLIARTVELGRDYPDAYTEPVDDPDGHPDEDWVVFRGRTQMLMTDENNDGFRVNQVMTFKLRQDASGLWKIIRWVDDPLSGGTECGTASSKPAIGISAWAAAKQD